MEKASSELPIEKYKLKKLLRKMGNLIIPYQENKQAKTQNEKSTISEIY